MAETLTHYAAEPVAEVHSTPQKGEPHFKPRGLWVSVDDNGDGWAEWCRAESFNLKALECVHEVTLADSANILTIRGAAQLDDFAEQYAQIPEYLRNMSFPVYRIRWDLVAAEYQGIVIAPYIWERRLDGGDITEWYYSWDCASGCIWDANAITSIRLIARQNIEENAA